MLNGEALNLTPPSPLDLEIRGQPTRGPYFCSLAARQPSSYHVRKVGLPPLVADGRSLWTLEPMEFILDIPTQRSAWMLLYTLTQ